MSSVLCSGVKPWPRAWLSPCTGRGSPRVPYTLRAAPGEASARYTRPTYQELLPFDECKNLKRVCCEQVWPATNSAGPKGFHPKRSVPRPIASSMKEQKRGSTCPSLLWVGFLLVLKDRTAASPGTELRESSRSRRSRGLFRSEKPNLSAVKRQGWDAVSGGCGASRFAPPRETGAYLVCWWPCQGGQSLAEEKREALGSGCSSENLTACQECGLQPSSLLLQKNTETQGRHVRRGTP